MRQLVHYNTQPHPTPRVYHLADVDVTAALLFRTHFGKPPAPCSKTKSQRLPPGDSPASPGPIASGNPFAARAQVASMHQQEDRWNFISCGHSFHVGVVHVCTPPSPYGGKNIVREDWDTARTELRAYRWSSAGGHNKARSAQR